MGRGWQARPRSSTGAECRLHGLGSQVSTGPGLGEGSRVERRPGRRGLSPSGEGGTVTGRGEPTTTRRWNWEQPSLDILTFQCSNCSSFWIFLICSIILEQKQLSRTQVADRPLRPEFQLQSEAGTRTWQLTEAEGGPPDKGLSPRGPLDQGDAPAGGPFQRHLSWSPGWPVLSR